MSKEKEFKKFSRLDLIVLKKLKSKVENRKFNDIIAEESDLSFKYPKNMMSSTYKKYGEDLMSLDMERLVYLIDSNRADLELRHKCIKVLFHKLNCEEDYPYKDLITKEEFIDDAVVPTILARLNIMIDFIKKEIEYETNENNRSNSRETDVVKVEAQKENTRRSNIDANGNKIKKPTIEDADEFAGVDYN